ncbi:hypothetical protein BD779DRAFT_1784073 [Infundibulicybe gibba]|nr:hypothetical protein BD779DRAFT_1784073 [Infundibulicybe gibba]
MSMFNIPTSERAGISRIPLEILSEIFVHCLPADSASQNTQQLLSSVCRLWRTLVLATPALWASLDIKCGTDVLRPPLSIIRTHLERSRAHPLSFILDTSRNFLSNGPHFPTALKVLVAARQRWGTVQIRLCRMTQDILDLITQGDAPSLRSIKCDIGGTRGSLSTPYECTTLLRLSPRLSSAYFGNIMRDPVITPHLTHPVLRTLTAVGEHSTRLLAALTLPALLNLHLVIGGAPTPLPTMWDIELSTFLKCNPSLAMLSLSMAHMQRLESTLLRILTLTPHLRGLSLSDSHLLDPLPLTAALIRALHLPPPSGALLLPHLSFLRLSRISDCPDGLCGEMLRARWGANAQANGVGRLEWAYIEFEDGVHDRDQAEMTELCAEGMQGAITLREPM